MSLLQKTMSDPRRRNLAILAAIAAVLVILAVLALWRQAAEMSPKYQPHPLFPNLPHEAHSVAQIRIASKKGDLDIVFKPKKGWVIASHNDFPASFAQVNRTVVGMATLEALETKTARAGWLHYLDLNAPPKGNGVLVSLLDEHGHTLAAIIAGKSADIGDKFGESGLYVRKPDTTQSWLAKSTFEPKTDVAGWYDKNLLGVERSQIAEATVTPAGGPAYTVKRDKPDDLDFKLVDVPPGRELAYKAAADGIGAAIADFTFDDAKPAKNFDFSNAWKITTRTFDGLTVTVQVVEEGKDYWATIEAQGAPGKPTAKEALAMDAKTSGWAYKLPAFRGQQLMTKLDSLLKPPPSKSAKAAPAK